MPFFPVQEVSRHYDGMFTYITVQQDESACTFSLDPNKSKKFWDE